MGRSALMAASKNGHTETVNMLLEHRAKVDLADKVRNRIHNYTSCRRLCETVEPYSQSYLKPRSCGCCFYNIKLC